MNLISRKQLVAPILAIVIALVVAISTYSVFLNLLQLKFADNLYNPSKASSEIVIVGIDNRTIETLGPTTSWSRSNYANMLRTLAKYDPKTVAFDIYFRDARDSTGDEGFASALKEAQFPLIISYMPEQAVFDADLGFMTYLQDTADYPLDLFLENTIVSTIFVQKDADDVLRKIVPKIFDSNRKEEKDSLVVAVVKAYLQSTETLDLSAIPLEDGQMPIRYFSNVTKAKNSTPDSSYPSISFSDLLTENFVGLSPEALFKDKIVLVGNVLPSSDDNFFTPVSGSYKMPGVEVHANAIQTILEKRFLRYMYPWEQILLIIFLSFASVFVFMYTRIRWSLLYLIGVGGGYAVLAPFVFDRGVIVDLVRPYLALALAFISVYVYRYVTEFRQKTELKNAFSKYVNPAIVNQITAHPEMLKLGGEKRAVTVIFTDIKGFTTVSEGLKPESLVALLNEYLEKMSDVIFNEGGTVDKYEGDAILAFFGAPVPQEDHAERACRTVLKMRRALTELNAKWATDPPLPGGEKKPQIEFRAGISAGDVIVGNIGSSKKLNYTVIGDNVNLGSRLEGVNKKYGTNILMSEDTFGLVKDLFITRDVDIIRVMGKHHPVRVYELLAEKALSDGADLTLLKLYEQGIGLYKERKFAEGLAKFEDILKSFPDDGPSKLYRQRCEVLRDFPPKADWDGVYEMGEK